MSASIVWLIIGIIYVIGILLSYNLVISKWDNPMFEKVWFSVVWIALIPLYVVYWLHNKF